MEAFLKSALYREFSFTMRPFCLPWKKKSRPHYRNPGELHSHFGWFWNEKNVLLLSGIEPRYFDSPKHRKEKKAPRKWSSMCDWQ